MPNLGGLDISPIILILLIMLIQRVIDVLHLPQRDSERTRPTDRLANLPWRYSTERHQRRTAA